MICIQKKANAQLQKGGVHSQQPLKFSITCMIGMMIMVLSSTMFKSRKEWKKK